MRFRTLSTRKSKKQWRILKSKRPRKGKWLEAYVMGEVKYSRVNRKEGTKTELGQEKPATALSTFYRECKATKILRISFAIKSQGPLEHMIHNFAVFESVM